MTKDVIIQALNDMPKPWNADRDESIKDFRSRSLEWISNNYQTIQQALKSLQGSIVIDKADVPEGLEEALKDRDRVINGEDLSTDEEWYPVNEFEMHIIFKAAQLIAEGLKDE